MVMTMEHPPETETGTPRKPLLRGWLHLGYTPIALICGLILTAFAPTLPARIGCAVYTLAAVQLFATSAAYHRGNWKPSTLAIFRRVDHSNIFIFIAGTYTPILISAFLPRNPALGWSLLALEWALAAIACTLTAIDLRKFRVFSMICYIGMGWAILPFWRQTAQYIGTPGFVLLLLGGISYTVGAILYGIGSKRPWFHSVFHIFVVLGSLLQFLSIFFYVL